MELRHLAFGYLRRRKGKAALITFGLSVAVGAIVLVLSLVLALRATMDERLTQYGSNVIVMPAAAEMNLSYGGMSIATTGTGEIPRLSESEVEAVRAIPSASAMSAVIPVLLEPIIVQGRPLLGLGADLEKSLRFKPWWRLEGRLPAAADEVVLGLNVRNEFGLELGDEADISGRTFEISGILWETGGEEDNLVFFDRAVLADLTGRTGAVNLIEVTAANTDVIDQLTTEIQDALPEASVASVKSSIEFTEQANSALADFGLAVTLLIVVIAGAVVMVTMLTAVKERQKEIGVLRAVGFKRRHIASLILLESVMLSSAGAVVGTLGGLAGAAAAPKLVGGLTLGLVVNPLVIVAGLVVAFVVGLSAALYPAWRAADLDPVTALKYI
ncbi:MAG: ABC transporter permease [Thermoleophilia bacterium]